MSVRLNKEFKINLCNDISLKYGSVNKKCPQVIYISGKMWLTPQYNGDFKIPIDFIYSKFKRELSKILKESNIFEQRHILDFDINPSNFAYNKKTFSSISFFLKQKGEKILKLNDIKTVISSDFGYLFRDLENDLIENEFEISKTK